VSAVRSSDAEPTAPIRLTIPADFRYLRLARVTAAAVAADMDFSVQDIDDVRVAVDELAAILIEDAVEGTEMEICFTIADHGGLAVEGHVVGGSQVDPDVHPVAAELLALVVDRYELSVDRGRGRGRVFRFWKQLGGDQG
jgi:serine/threonine-protein kinase RsbW